jgi:threonine/homoserine/homoserine lactone efflux protein
MYLSLIPQLERPAPGHLAPPGFIVGGVQIVAPLTVNFCIVLAAGSIASFLRFCPTWLRLQRYLLGTALGALAIKLPTGHARPSTA